jgi:phage gpG-like protein
MKGRVLSRTGMLYNSVQLVQADANGIRVVAGGAHVPYAQLHNKGGTIQRQVTVRAHHRREHFANTRRGRVKRKAAIVRRHQMRMNLHIRKRQFMGKSHMLDIQMRKTILASLRKVMNTR